MNIEKLEETYNAKITEIDVLIESQKRLRSLAREGGDSCDVAVHSADINGLNKLRQAYVQFLHDLEDL